MILAKSLTVLHNIAKLLLKRASNHKTKAINGCSDLDLDLEMTKNLIPDKNVVTCQRDLQCQVSS